MYDDNPTLENIYKEIDPLKQGEAYEDNSGLESDEKKRHFYIESYGCAMNFSDSEIVASVLHDMGFGSTKDMNKADLILINTCSIREKAETNVRHRLREFDKIKRKKPGVLIGVLGCMAERMKTKLLEEEKLVDLVVGPDAYRDLPILIGQAEEGHRAINVFLSREETYADISPLRLDSNGISAFISITRGCNNMCSFCVVPYTRGRERSRNAYSIVAEASELFERGYREITLLGQNVDSYTWKNPETDEGVSFTELLVLCAEINPLLRVRFSTSHPKDMTNEVLFAMAKYHNICNYIHLPVQSGNSRVLDLMNRTYDREWYMERVESIYRIIPDCAISSDIITGFCTETEEEHQDTLNMIEWAKYSMSYMFFYSERPGTIAQKKYEDDIPHEIKKRRLQEVVDLQMRISHEHNQRDLGKTFEILIEGNSKKSDLQFKGRNTHNKMVIFDKREGLKPGDYVNVLITAVTRATLIGEIA